ncbi:transposase [Brevibacillus parabrevis]
MTEIDLVTAENMVAEIGGLSRFGSANQLARFAGIAPIETGSDGI